MTRSIQQLPNNSGTTSVTEVYTATGFNAGDPVYFQNGDYKSPANLTPPSTVDFTFTNQAAVNPNGVGGIVAPSFTFEQMQTGIAGGTARRFAAVLTNGNIVQAWTNYTPSPSTPNQIYFRIINPSGTIVVSPTVVSAIYTNSNNSAVSVVALTGGGFSVGWINNTGGTANSVNYAIYSNTGSVVTAATQDTTFATGAGQQPIEMTNLANGGFAIAIKNTSGVLFLRAYSSAGVGAYSTITVGITGTEPNTSFALTARSDSSVFICDRVSASNYTYSIYASTGAAIVSAATFNIGFNLNVTNAAGLDATVLTDGTTIVLGYTSSNGSYPFPALRFLPTGNTLSAEVAGIPIANLFYQTAYTGGYLSVLTLSSNNLVMYFSDGYGNMQYAFYSSSGVCISGANGSGAIPLQVTGGYCNPFNRVTLLEAGGFVYAYWTASKATEKPVQQVYCKISTSTYTVAPIAYLAGTPYTVTGQPVGAYIPSTVNPNSLSYYSTTSSTAVATNTPATLVGPTTIAGVACDAIASCSLPNGNFVVAYRISSTNVLAAVYSSIGSLVTSVTVGSSTAGSAFTVRVAALSGGGFVVAHASTDTVATLTVFSSGYAVTGSTTLTIYSYSTAYNFDIAGLPNNNFVFVYNMTGSDSFARIYSSSLASVQTFAYASLITQSFTVASNPWGGFAVCGWYSAAGAGYRHVYAPTATNTWAEVHRGGFTMSAFVQNPQLVATQSGAYIYTNYASAYPAYAMFTDSGATAIGSVGAMTSWPSGSPSNPTSYPMMGIGMTGNGNVVIATSYSGANLGISCLPAQMTFSSGQPLPYKTSSANNVPMFSLNTYSSSIVSSEAAQPRVTPGLGNTAIITFKNVNSYPSFIIINGTSVSTPYTIVAGVTPSALTPIAPATTSSNIKGVLVGIAVTTAAAGSTGQVAINGPMLLGSSYTSTATGAFDSTGAAVIGVKGTFNGRSVNLQGNS